MLNNIPQAAIIGLTLFCATAQAAPIMPDFSTVPAGWTTDRYAPNGFANVGAFQGRNDVLGISIANADGLANRPAAYQSAFYNTQGKAHSAVGGAGSVLAADLYIPAEWLNAANGNVRTDMWGVMSDGANVTDYGIIGFTNYGGAARLRVWDSDLLGGSGNWVDVAMAPTTSSWMSLAIDFDGASYVYSIDGTVVYTDTSIHGTTQFSSVLMQAYNFNDPSIAGAVPVDYTAHWANTAEAAAVPEPGDLALMMIGLAGFAAARRSRRNARG